MKIEVGNAGPRWERQIAGSCAVVNIERWNRNFPNWPVIRLNGSN